MSDIDRNKALKNILESQRKAHLANLPVSAKARQDRIQKVINLLVNNKDALCNAMNEDFGHRHPTFSLMNDILGSVMSLDHAKTSLKKWMKSSKRSTVPPFSWFGSKGQVDYHPKGVVGIIAAWNAPLFTLFAPLASALAAGNRAILKPSELAPNTAACVAGIFKDGMNPQEVAVVTGGPTFGSEFTAMPFNQLIFTGGGVIGKKIMANAAENLTPVILELGGKSPVVISRSADLDDAAQKIAFGKGNNGGQICISPDTVFVPNELVNSFVEKLKTEYDALYPNKTETTGAINEMHLDRVQGYISDAKTRGAGIVKAGMNEAKASSRQSNLSIVISPDADSDIANQEIFGSGIIIYPYDDIKDAVKAIQNRPNPLALYYFGKDRAEETYVLDNILSGGASVNDVLMHAAMNDAPFGGVGASGMGAYHGREGFEALSHARTLYRAGWWNPRKAFGMLPPYSDKLTKMVEKTALKYRRDI
jgi:coniferyl-aldehyde dehydrogenase